MFMSRHDAFPTPAAASRAAIAAAGRAASAARAAGEVRFAVRRARVSDAAAYARILGHPEVYPNVLQMPWASADDWQVRLAEASGPANPDLRLVAETVGDAPEVVGTAGLHVIGTSPRRRHTRALAITVDAAWQGRGVGTLLMQSLCDYADRWLGLLRIELEVYADNLRAQALYKRFGFVQEGYHRCDALRDGAYVDSLSMARLNPKPLAGFPRA
jgi:putative acetyltransferase